MSYLNLAGTFYYLCSILDGYSRSIVHYEIREPMTEQTVGELGLRRVQPSRRTDVEIIPATARRAGCGRWKPFPRPSHASFRTTARPGSLTMARSLWRLISVACSIGDEVLLAMVTDLVKTHESDNVRIYACVALLRYGYISMDEVKSLLGPNRYRLVQSKRLQAILRSVEFDV